MEIELTEEEAAALLALLNRTIDDDRYPLSPRIRTLRNIRAKFPAGSPEPPPAEEAADAGGTQPAASPVLWVGAVNSAWLHNFRNHARFPSVSTIFRAPPRAPGFPIRSYASASSLVPNSRRAISARTRPKGKVYMTRRDQPVCTQERDALEFLAEIEDTVLP
jgi:hypothetical protein